MLTYKTKNLFYNTIFIIICVLILYTYPYFEFFNVPLDGVHIWRQADCLSLSKTFKIFESSLFEPRVLNLGHSGNGKTGSDFPLIYYLISVLGDKPYFELFYKSFGFIVSLLGLLSLFKLLSAYFNRILSSALPILLLTSSTFVFYSANYLMNIYSLSFVFIAAYFYSKYLKSQNKLFFLYSLILTLIASLIKTTAMAHVLVSGLTLIVFLIFNRKKKHLFKKEIFSIIFIITIVATWITFIKHYNFSNNSGMFLTGILPIWHIDFEQILSTLNEIYARRGYHFNHYSFWIILAAIIIALIDILKRKVCVYLDFAFLTYCFGFVLYFLLFFQVLDQHDYYFTNWLIIFPFSILVISKTLFNSKKRQLLFKFILLSLIIDSFFYCHLRMNDRYSDWRNEVFTNYVSPLQFDYNQKFKPFISFNEPVFVPSDSSINISLYVLNAVGWTGYNRLVKSDLPLLKYKKLKFLVLTKNEEIPAFLANQIKKHIKVSEGKYFDLIQIEM